MLWKARILSGLENLGQFASSPNMPHDSPQPLPFSQLRGQGGRHQTQPSLPLASQRAEVARPAGRGKATSVSRPRRPGSSCAREGTGDR